MASKTYIRLESKRQSRQRQLNGQNDRHDDTKGQQHAVGLKDGSAAPKKSYQKDEEAHYDDADRHRVRGLEKGLKVGALLDDHEAQIDEQATEYLRKDQQRQVKCQSMICKMK